MLAGTTCLRSKVATELAGMLTVGNKLIALIATVTVDAVAAALLNAECSDAEVSWISLLCFQLFPDIDADVSQMVVCCLYFSLTRVVAGSLISVSSLFF